MVRLYLHLHPELHLYTVIDNEPLLTAVDQQQVDAGIIARSRIADKQRVRCEEEYYIDEFGRYVYITSRIGTSADLDLRYDGEPEPELFTLQLIEHAGAEKRGSVHNERNV